MASATSSSARLIRPRPGLVTAADGGDDRQRGIQAAAHVPGRQHVVDRAGMIGRTGDERKAETGVDRVVHAGGTVSAAQQLDVDDVGAPGGQRPSTEPVERPAALVTTMPSPSTISRWTSSWPSVERKSMVAERFPLFSPVQ